MRKINVLLLLGIVIFCFPHQVSAQGPPQAAIERATKEADRLIREETEEKLRAIPGKPPEIKKEEETEAEGPKFFVKKIKLTGVESFSPEEFKLVTEKYENREVSFGELKKLAKEVERAYLKKGIIAACFVPPQEVRGRTVNIRVVEAKMGLLNVLPYKYFSRNRIKHYWSIAPDETLRYDEISRSLQLINKNPDIYAKAALHAGEKPGTTDVTISAKTRYPLHLIGSIDREGLSSMGNWRYGTGFRHNNFLGLGDTLLSGYLLGEHYYGIYAYHTIPVTYFGTSLVYGYNYNKTTPKGDYRDYNIDTRAKNASVFLYQDLYKKDTYAGDVFVGLDAKNKRIAMTTGVRNRDRLRIIRAGGNFVYRNSGNVTYIKPKISQGITGLGARRKDVLTSRHTDITFTKFNMQIRHKRKLPHKMQLGVKFDSQFVFTRLASQEQFSLGGMKSVRGYPTADYLADNAFQTNVELLFPAFLIPKSIKIPYAAKPLRDDVTGLAFFDYACGSRRGRNRWTEKGIVNLASFGAGVRVRLFNQALVRLEWAFPLMDKPITGSNNVRFHFSLDFEDKIPEEIERLNRALKGT